MQTTSLITSKKPRQMENVDLHHQQWELELNQNFLKDLQNLEQGITKLLLKYYGRFFSPSYYETQN